MDVTTTTISSPPDFKALFESGPALCLVLNPELVIVAVSDAYLRATMTTREDIIGGNIFDVFPDNPDDPEATGMQNLQASLNRVLQYEAPDTMAVQKYDIRKPESEGGGFEERYWSPINSPVFDAQGKVRYIIHRVEDVTEYVRLRMEQARKNSLAETLKSHAEQVEAEIYVRARQVQDANSQLQEANEELARLYKKTKELFELKTRFFSNVSHELRTPLSLILGPVEKMLLEANITTEQRESLQVVARNARSLLRHVNDFLDVAKLDAGKVDIHYSREDASALLKTAASHFDILARERNIAFSVEAPGKIMAVFDAEKMMRVFLNLLSNAFKFTPDGGAIRVGLEERKKYVRFYIDDSGPGVPPDLREAIFEPFRQGEEVLTRRFGGTGLGLSIVREFVELQNGTVNANESTLGGARFEIHMPLAAPPNVTIHPSTEPGEAVQKSFHETIEAQRDKPVAPATALNIGRPRVLVVEDNADMNQFIGATLAPFYDVITAQDGQEGLQQAIALRPDLILTDMMMPRMSGDQMVKLLRDEPRFSDTPIIVLTAKADDALLTRLLREGAQDYLLKPFIADELLARIKNLIDAKQAKERLNLNQRELQNAKAQVDAYAMQLQEKIRISEEKYRLLVEHAEDSIFILKADGTISETNRAAETLLGVPRSAIIGQKPETFLSQDCPPGMRTRLNEAVTAATLHLENVPVQPVKGRLRHVDFSSSSVQMAGSPLVLLIAHDISEHLELERQLHQAQKMEAIGQLISGIMHDFNNVLTVITGNLDLMIEKCDLDEQAATLAQEALNGSVRGAELTKRLLAVARKQALQPQEVDVGEALERIVPMLRRVLGENIQIMTVLATDAWPTFIDASRLEDAILNLVVNARDAMPEGGRLLIETATVTLDPFAAGRVDAAPGDYIMLSVTDSGTGMPPQVVDRAFEPFFTTKPEGRGTGLGLSMVYGFVKQSQGYITITSAVGRGTSVKIYLPRYMEAKEPIARTVAKIESEIWTCPLGHETILVVEDDPAVRSIATGMIRELGYRVEYASSGAMALEILRTTPEIDLLFTDVVMPNGMSGVDLLYNARKIRPDLRAIFTSGYSDHAMAQREEAGPNVPILVKPYRKIQLAEKIRKVLDTPLSQIMRM